MSKSTSTTANRFNTAYGPNIAYSGLNFDDCELMTKQADKDACDINNIMDQYGRTGMLPQGSTTPMFGDFSDGNDYQQKLNLVLDAQDSFMALDAKLRSRFNNDPAQLLNFIADPDNRDEAIKIGLIAKKLDTSHEKKSPSSDDVKAASENSETPKTSST